MSRSVHKVNVEIVETITVYDSTGAEVTGLVNGDFTKVLHKDGVASAVAVTVAEISGGDYKVTFTPDAAGAWRLLIQQSSGSAHNKRGWQATYDVSTGGVLSTTDIAQAVWDFVVETGFAANRMLRIIAAAVAGKSTGGKSSLTARDLANAENMIVGSADESGNRTPTSYGG